MLEIFSWILFAFIALFILVTVHEYGHFAVARAFGVRVLRFSIGFGPVLFKYKRGHTEYALSAIPMGGYVKMYGEHNLRNQGQPLERSSALNKSDSEQQLDNESAILDAAHPDAENAVEVQPYAKDESYAEKAVWKRMLIVLAGPIANFFLAAFLYTIIFMGGVDSIKPVIDQPLPNSVAAIAGLPAESTIVNIDGVDIQSWANVFDALIKRVGDTGSIQVNVELPASNEQKVFELPIERYEGDTATPDFLGALGISAYTPGFTAEIREVVEGSAAKAAGLVAGDTILTVDNQPYERLPSIITYIQERPQQPIFMTVDRAGEDIDITLVPQVKNDKGYAGMGFQTLSWPDNMRVHVSYSPIEALLEGFHKTVDTSWLILSSLGKLITGNISTKSIGGPVSIAKVAGESAESGLVTYIGFLAVMSVMLFVVNLLPIPVLDGGHFMFYCYEAIRGKALPSQIQALATQFGMLAMFSLMLFALYNDFTRL